jgi:hypothetical protein
MLARVLPRSPCISLSAQLFKSVHLPRFQTRAFATTMPQLKHRAVAGTFLFKFPNDDLSQHPKVALFRRSDKVRTYQ